MLPHVPPVLNALFCGRASPDKLRYCGRGGHLRSGTYAAGSAPFFVGGTCGSDHEVTAARPGRARPCRVMSFAWVTVRLRGRRQGERLWAARSPACFLRPLGGGGRGGMRRPGGCVGC